MALTHARPSSWNADMALQASTRRVRLLFSAGYGRIGCRGWPGSVLGQALRQIGAGPKADWGRPKAYVGLAPKQIGAGPKAYVGLVPVEHGISPKSAYRKAISSKINHHGMHEAPRLSHGAVRRRVLGETPVAWLKAVEKCAGEEKPVWAAFALSGRSVVRRRCSASTIRRRRTS